MSSIPSVGAAPPLPPVGYPSGGENRQTPPAPAVRGARRDSSTPTEPAGPVGAKPRANAVDTVAQDKVDVAASRQLAAKSGLVEGSFEPFIDIIDPRYQTRIARVFGPDASGPAPEAPPARIASKAYEAADAAAKAAFNKNA
ncbi:MAG: hypothetical protein ING44_02360 [Telmatospirillum sp.]|nr:hypothetical protein [Telmatospirillum sp.]